MLVKIKRFFDSHLAPDSIQAKRNPKHVVRLAVAALLVEVAESDYRQVPEEKQALLELVGDHFGIHRSEAKELIDMAEDEHSESTDYFQFTNLINKTYSPEQKIRLVEDLWRVAFSDDKLHRYEEHVVRRLAGLIHVSHKDFIAAKHRVIQQR